MTYCPHCQQPLPEPPPRFCPVCAYDLQAAGEPMATVPDTGSGAPPPPPPPFTPPPLPGAPPPAGGGTPWEARQQIGFASAFVDTTQQVLTGPSAFFRSMPVTGGIGGPLLYGVIAGYIGLVASALYAFILRSAMGSAWSFGQNSELDRIMPMLSSGVGLVGQVIFGPLAVVIGLFVVSAVVHVCLMALGGATHGFEATLRVAAYAEAAMVIRIIPVCGDLIAIVYYVVLAIIGLSEAHRISGVKATAAVLLPFVLLCCCCGAAMAAAVGGFASLMQQMR